jgi:hypothetical protein
MGGQALKNTYTRRYSKEEYVRLEDTVQTRLKSLGIKSRVPKSFGAKSTFGDLDVLILAESLNNRDMRDIIEDHFAPNEIYHNTSVYSFDYKEFQIDFILVKTKYWDTSYNYYSYNDLGNLIGRISYQMGFRYGHYGLKLVYRHPDGGRKFEMLISQDIERILDFLGFDVSEYKIGFYELRDIFAYVIKSKYFNPKIFQYEALNHQNKTRNKKRVNYAGFLDYIEGEKFDNPYEYKDKDHYVTMAEDYFGLNIVEQIDSWKKVVERDKEIAEKFNGHIIMEHVPGLKGKELGSAITNFKKHIMDELLKDDPDGNPNQMLKLWLTVCSSEYIMQEFKRFYYDN